MAQSLYRDEGNAREALVALERSLRLDPDNAEARLMLGLVYGQAGMFARAEPQLRRAVALFAALAADDPARAAQLSEARNTLAAVLLNLGRPREALPLLREVLNDVHYAAQHLALENLGMAYLALQRPREAAHALERALAVQPTACGAAYHLGEAYVRQNDYGRALEALGRALGTRAPGCDRIQAAYRVRGEVHVQLHQPDAARADFARCRDLGPGTRDGRECSSLLRTAEGP